MSHFTAAVAKGVSPLMGVASSLGTGVGFFFSGTAFFAAGGTLKILVYF